jgi:RNA polymerase sigma factor for flagellar operon FliA
VELNSDLENQLWQRTSTQDSQAQVELFQYYSHLVLQIAGQLKRRLPAHVRLDDLQSAGQEGLWKAIQSFSSDKGIPFGGYANRRIRGAMLDELRRTDDLSRTQRAQWNKAQSAYGHQHSSAMVSLDDVERYEWIVDDTAMSPEESAIQSSEVSELNRALIRLSDQEQLVLAMIFVEGLSLVETAEVMSLSRSRVSTIYSAALKSLKGSMLRRNRQA